MYLESAVSFSVISVSCVCFCFHSPLTRAFEIGGFSDIEISIFRDSSLRDLKISRFKSRIYVTYNVATKNNMARIKFLRLSNILKTNVPRHYIFT